MTWTRGRVVGRGSSATVSLATARPSGEIFAVKSAELSDSDFLQREGKFLCALNCPQIVAYRGCDTTLEDGKLVYNLFMEYAAGGSLTDLIRGGGRLDEAAIGYYAREVLLGIEYLHCNGIVHCDVKGRNVLVAEDGVRVADLGCAKRVSDADAPIAGTPAYMAPEVARGEEQGFAADIWAFGCTVIEMATGRSPWGEASDPVSTLYRIGYSGDVPEIPSFMSKQGRDFLGKCLIKDPGCRWSAKQLLGHAFLEGPTNFVSKEVGGFNSDTPTSVLDQGLWGSEIETIPTQMANPPAERVRRLSSPAADWEEEEWVSVRSNEEGGLVENNEKTETETVGESEMNSRDKEERGGRDSCVNSSNRQQKKLTFVICNCNQLHLTYGNLIFQNMDVFFVGFITLILHVFNSTNSLF